MTEECEAIPADIIMMVDSSSSLCGDDPEIPECHQNWQNILTFTVALVQSLYDAHQHTRIGFVKFSEHAVNEFYLNSYTDELAIVQAIKSAEYMGGRTNISGALLTAYKQQLTLENGERPFASDVGILLTDGKSTLDADKTIDSAAAAKASGMKIFAVGITGESDEVELRQISSPPQKYGQNYFLCEDYADLPNFVHSVASESCPTYPGKHT